MEKGFHHRKITPLWPEANGHAENFTKNIGKVARTAQSQGKDWRRELYVFVANYRAIPHPSTGKSPYELWMTGQWGPSSSPFQELILMLKPCRRTNKRRHEWSPTPTSNVKKNCTTWTSEITLWLSKVFKIRQALVLNPSLTLEARGSRITAKRATDQRLVTRWPAWIWWARSHWAHTNAS